MATELTIHAVHRGGMRFTVGNGTHEIESDYPLQPGDPGTGLRSLELLLAALATCAGNTLALVLGRMEHAFTGLEVDARGTRREEHPTVLTAIHLDFAVHGPGVDRAVVEKAIAVAETQLAPVWIMVKAGTPITTSVRLDGD
jgi:putative redox protein